MVSLYSLNSTKGKRCNAPLTKHESSSMKGALHLLHENEFLHSMSSPKKKKEGRLDKVPHVNIMQLLGLASCFREHKSQLNVISSSYKK